MEEQHATFDATVPESFDSPYPAFAAMRARCPIAYSPSWNGFYALLTYDEVARVAADYRNFTTTVQNVVPRVTFTGRRPPLHLDPPDHTPYRRAIAPLLQESRIARLEPLIRDIAVRHLDGLIARGEGDLCLDFSTHIPIDVFAAWMNISSHQVGALTRAGRAYNIAVQDNDSELVRKTSLELYELARELIAERRAAPQDPELDFTSALLQAEHEGEKLHDDLILGTIRQVLVVGIIAPTVMVGSIGVHLARDQALQSALRADPSLIPASLEEFLRLYTPYRGFARTPVRDVTIAGCPVAEGKPIAVVYAAANRDPARFVDPDRFIAGRPNIGDHLAFGRGPHSCPGAALGRLQLRIALEELLARTSVFTLAAEPSQTRWPEIGALRVPVRLVPRMIDVHSEG